ncbi:MAG: glycosyltransferase [Spirochaetales bacterium]|nr:glycosyltransferase [Spirochaetales bacterium]
MRIAIFSDSYRPEINGVVTSVDTVCDELREQGHEVYIFAPRYFGRRDDNPWHVRFPSIPFPFPQMKERRVSLPWGGALRKFGKLEIDVIHSQVPGTNGIYALIASWLWRVPHVHTYHTHYMEYTHYMPFALNFSKRAVIWIARHFCGRCQHVISPSHGMREAILEHGVDAPVSVVPTGIDMRTDQESQALSDLLTRYDLGDPARVSGKRLLVSVGRLGREKNICYLIRALAIIKERHDFHFLMIGNGPDRSEIEELIDRLGLGDRVTLVGYVGHEDIFAFIQQCDLFVFASVTETQGLVLLESMSVGTPVVAIEGIGVSDLLEHNTGGLATRSSMVDFTNAVDRMLSDDELLHRKGVEALERAHEWSVENQVAKIIRIYRDSIDDFRRHGLPRFRRRQRY